MVREINLFFLKIALLQNEEIKLTLTTRLKMRMISIKFSQAYYIIYICIWFMRKLRCVYKCPLFYGKSFFPTIFSFPVFLLFTSIPREHLNWGVYSSDSTVTVNKQKERNKEIIILQRILGKIIHRISLLTNLVENFDRLLVSNSSLEQSV